MHILLVICSIMLIPCLFAAELGSPTTDERLKGLIGKYDTFIRGKVVSISHNQNAPEDFKAFTVVVEVEEQLSGAPYNEKQISVFIHSPTMEFGGLRENEIKEHQCVFACSFKDGKLQGSATPFEGHVFNAADIERLKKFLKESNAKK